jgi:hypothetical protein
LPGGWRGALLAINDRNRKFVHRMSDASAHARRGLGHSRIWLLHSTVRTTCCVVVHAAVNSFWWNSFHVVLSYRLAWLGGCRRVA